MTHFFKTQVGRLRLIGYLEGISLLVLIFVAVPIKHYFNNPDVVKALGPVHGALFLLFVFYTISVGVEEKWKFKETTWKVLLACIIPFGTFYIDRHILKNQIPKATAN
jgi:integral membrane protein